MKIVRYCHVDGQRMVSLLWTFSVRGPPVWFSIVLLGGSHTFQVSSVASCDRMPRTLGIPRFFSHPGYPFYRKLEVLNIFWGGCWGRWISWHVSHMFFFFRKWNYIDGMIWLFLSQFQVWCRGFSVQNVHFLSENPSLSCFPSLRRHQSWSHVRIFGWSHGIVVK